MIHKGFVVICNAYIQLKLIVLGMVGQAGHPAGLEDNLDQDLRG